MSVKPASIGKESKIFILFKFNVPRQIYNKEAPNKKKPEIKALEIKYFNPASVEKTEFRLKVAKM
jgi:hypothetical protein